MGCIYNYLILKIFAKIDWAPLSDLNIFDIKNIEFTGTPMSESVVASLQLVVVGMLTAKSLTDLSKMLHSVELRPGKLSPPTHTLKI